MFITMENISVLKSRVEKTCDLEKEKLLMNIDSSSHTICSCKPLENSIMV